MNSPASDIHPLDQETELDAIPLLENDIVGEYRIEEVIGRGGFGTVYRAAHPLIGKVVAIKVLKRQFSSRRETVSRFVAEARAVNKIQHRNIIDIFSFGRMEDGRHYYVMEYLKGCTLGEALARRGRFPIAEALMIFDQLGRALAAANAHGIVHRDLKPDNIFLVDGDDGSTTVKLLDFGIAKLIDPLGLGNETQAGTTMGTPAYMSPEQVNDRDCDQRSDVYAFGVLFYEVLAGAPPFVGESPMATLAMQVRDRAPLLSSRAPQVGTIFDAAVARMLDKDPGLRPATALVALEEIFAAADEGGIALAGALARSSSRDWSSYLSVRVPEPTPRSLPPSSRGPSSLTPTPRVVGPAVDTLPEGVPAGAIGKTSSTAAPAPPPARSGAATKIIGAVAMLALAAAIVWRGAGGAATPAAASAPPPSAPPASAPTSIHLVVSSDPSPATVVLDGVEIGHTPLTTTIARDERSHDLVVSAPGFVPRRTQLTPSHDLEISSSLSAEAPGAKPTVEAVSQHGLSRPAPRDASARVEPTTPTAAPTPVGLGAPGKPTARPLDGRDPWK
jgi:serine/threonine-protein kinase